MKLSLGLPLTPFLDSDFSLLRGTLGDVRWVPQGSAFLCLRSLGEVTSRPLLDEIDYELSQLTWEPFHIVFQHVYHRLGNNDDRLTTQPIPHASLDHLYRNIERRLRAASCVPNRQRFQPETPLGFLEPGRERDTMPWIQRHNLFRSQPLTVDRLTLVEVFGHNESFSYRPLETYSCYGQAFPLPEYDDSF